MLVLLADINEGKSMFAVALMEKYIVCAKLHSQRPQSSCRHFLQFEIPNGQLMGFSIIWIIRRRRPRRLETAQAVLILVMSFRIIEGERRESDFLCAQLAGNHCGNRFRSLRLVSIIVIKCISNQEETARDILQLQARGYNHVNFSQHQFFHKPVCSAEHAHP